mmetsp:Transcript_17459/g.48403  ORF Transcript_17459/g.48403 Transcript_17459/m.48403 type:complete len:97 (+) Transcript_17459:2807-3097(+)
MSDLVPSSDCGSVRIVGVEENLSNRGNMAHQNIGTPHPSLWLADPPFLCAQWGHGTHHTMSRCNAIQCSTMPEHECGAIGPQWKNMIERADGRTHG